MAHNKQLLFSVLTVLLCFSCCFLIPCTVRFLDGERWLRSADSLGNIGQAFRMYHKVNGKLPPAVVQGKDGKPLYSWRVLLLPYLEGDDPFRQFHLEEPWDSPHNKKLAETTPRCYVPAGGGEDSPGLTRYQVLVGPGTAFEKDGLTWNDFPDGPANTILVVEAGEAVPWSKPVDLAYDPGKPLPRMGGVHTRPVHFLCYEVGREAGFIACFGDGKTHFIGSGTDEKSIRGFITRNGGEAVDPSRLD